MTPTIMCYVPPSAELFGTLLDVVRISSP